jgi:hypothetical protein
LKQLASKRDWKIRNDRHRDLMLVEANELKVLFEVKTKVNTQSICTGLGQLLLYCAMDSTAILVLVLPDKLPAKIATQLKMHNIQVLYYTWKNSSPRFQSLTKLISF